MMIHKTPNLGKSLSSSFPSDQEEKSASSWHAFTLVGTLYYQVRPVKLGYRELLLNIPDFVGSCVLQKNNIPRSILFRYDDDTALALFGKVVI